MPGQKITTCLWFEDEAEAAAELYVSLFEDSKIVGVARHGEGGPAPAGSVLMVTLELAGQRLLALNGRPDFAFNDSVSLSVDCESQAEVDALWDGLTAGGGAPGRCGWLKDRFGVSWQIVPSALPRLMQDDDPARVQRVTEAMLKMGKLDVAALEAAYDRA